MASHVSSSAEMSAKFANTGFGPQLSILDIGLDDRVAVVEPNTAFWAVVETARLPEMLHGSKVEEFIHKRKDLEDEMEYLRAGIKPSAVYLNPTERCNFNCPYCYIPQDMRKNGSTMSAEELLRVLDKVENEFRRHLPEGIVPQIIFHGSEPMMARESMFAAIAARSERFQFGVQTNASLLDESAIAFLREHDVAVGISLDAPDALRANAMRTTWDGTGAYAHVVRVIDAMRDYPAFSVIATVTSQNVESLVDMVDFLHERQVTMCMLNPVRCTQKRGLDLKPDDDELARSLFAALDRTWELYKKTGRKLVVANFANVLAGIAGPTTRRLMCDVSPCGGGRCFVAVAANGDVFPCSEFVGFQDFKSGNIFENSLDEVLSHPAMRCISERRIERFSPCSSCAIRHFCGSPCPAELHAVHGSTDVPALYCKFYEEQVRYAFRVLAHERQDAYLWDGWEDESAASFS